MQILFVRHGESQGNAEERMQGHSDYPLTDLGRMQAARLGRWLKVQGIGWDHAYVSPLERARQTAAIVRDTRGGPHPVVEPRLIELSAGAIEGLTRPEIIARFPRFAERHLTEIGNFSEFGGESYEQVQARAGALREHLESLHRMGEHRVLLVGHGGFHFQMIKLLVCEAVPRVMNLRLSNCAATLVHLRQRHSAYMGELLWHVPVELMEIGSSSA